MRICAYLCVCGLVVFVGILWHVGICAYLCVFWVFAGILGICGYFGYLRFFAVFCGYFAGILWVFLRMLLYICGYFAGICAYLSVYVMYVRMDPFTIPMSEHPRDNDL